MSDIFRFPVGLEDLDASSDWNPHDPWDRHYTQPAKQDRDRNLEDYLQRWLPVIFKPASVTVTTGTLAAGDVTSIRTFNDGSVWNITEVGGTPGYDLRIDFAGVTTFNRLHVNLSYTNGSAHTIDLEIWNFVTSAWNTLAAFTGLANATQFAPGIIDSVPYTSAGVVHVRIYHVSAGNAAHSIQVDYVALGRNV